MTDSLHFHHSLIHSFIHSPMKDITTRTDLALLMQKFYDKVFADDLIGFYFTEVVKVNLEKHIPVIADFWESVVFDRGTYQGNVMQVHQQIHQLSAFRDEHFIRWVTLFKQTVDESFAGEISEKLKQRAESIATVMRLKTVHSGIGITKG